MLNYLIKTLILAVFSFIIIYFYYFGGVNHIENFDGYLSYVLIIGIIYGIYKYLQFEKSEKVASFSLLKIGGFFFLHLLILSCLFFYYNDIAFGQGIVFFFKILGFMILPTSIVLISLGFGKKLTSYLEYAKNETGIYNFILSLGVGFFSFVFLLDIIGILGFYNYYVVFLILSLFVGVSYKELKEIFTQIFEYKFEVDIEEGNYFKLLSSEFLFFVSTLVLSISLISVFRPFPIGWDDLGAYMNHPQLMAEAGSIIALGKMYAWQTFTGIGYMFGSATQAFYLNNVGGILSFLVLTLVTYDLLKYTGKDDEKTIINIPMLVGTIFISMPMIVFQQAKDMKLDSGLFFVSVIVIYLLFKYYLRLDNKTYLEKVKGFIDNKILHKTFNKSNLLIIFVIGVLAGFAFSIKFTSLLLISGLIGTIFFIRMGLVGFIGYLSIYFAIFTKGNLWGMMNVIVNPEQILGFESKFALISVTIGVICLGYSVVKNNKIIKKLLLEISILLLGILVALVPWLGKNINESRANLSVISIISGKGDSYVWNRTDILSQDEITKIIEDKKEKSLSSKGISDDEDYGRYFGYEKGANNYIKLPWNLTMQLNQSGEYTDIGYIFLALIPVLFLFLPFRRKSYAYLIVLFLILELLIFIKPNSGLIEGSDIDISVESRVNIFTSNNEVFQKGTGKNIYKIDVDKYITDENINSLVNENNTYEFVKTRANQLFYEELKRKVLNNELGPKIELTATDLTQDDFNLIKELRVANTSLISFNDDINSIQSLEDIIQKKGLEQDREKLLSMWKSKRSINQMITDFFSKYNLPYGYLFVLLVFFVPTIILIFTIGSKKSEDSNIIKIFKFNLIFACFYTFLWAISAFGIVWYGITMYFSFLLSIAIGIYYLSVYEDNDGDKVIFTKLFGTIVFSIIVLIYIVNSVIPHSFNNLKGAGYTKYKLGQLTPEQANFAYHPEYLKILFHTNIAEEKREEFLKENIKKSIQDIVAGIDKMDIDTVKSLLTELSTKPEYSKHKKDAILSLNSIYKGISHPKDEYKNTVGIYRIGTFLKYHISENNKRLLEDSLINQFNDYIYNSNINTTVENLNKIGIKYLLVDLNAATIDKDERHNLTTRYEKLLSTMTSDKLSLIETDSICLKIGLEEFKKSNKFTEDRERFITIAGVNYESYDEKGNVIPRGTKLFKCYELINDLIKNNKIDNENYNYLLNIKNYIDANKENFETDNQVYKLLQQQVKHGYKVMFQVNSEK